MTRPLALPTVGMAFPHLARTALATWVYVPRVFDWDARANAFLARALVLIGYARRDG